MLKVLWFLSTLALGEIKPIEPLKTHEKEVGEFSGRVSKINRSAKLVRFRIQFRNMKYLNKGNTVDFWTHALRSNKCKGLVKGKTTEYILVLVPQFERCIQDVFITAGVYVRFFSKDLVGNIQKGEKVISIMLKRKIALNSKKKRAQKELDTYTNRVDAINKKYEVLKEKLEQEWRESLSDLENEKSITLRKYKNLEILLSELDYKLERYKVFDDNLELDRWSLDEKLYFKK